MIEVVVVFPRVVTSWRSSFPAGVSPERRYGIWLFVIRLPSPVPKKLPEPEIYGPVEMIEVVVSFPLSVTV